MLRIATKAIPLLGGVGLLAACGQADAAILADVTRTLQATRASEPFAIEPFFSYAVFDASTGQVPETMLTLSPPPPGTSAYDFSGVQLAAVAARLTDGEGDERHSFTLGIGRDFNSGFALFDTDLFGPGGDLKGRAVVEGVRLTLTDLCLQPFGTEGCPTVPAGDSGYYAEVRFQVFGTAVPEPASLAMLASALLLLGLFQGRYPN